MSEGGGFVSARALCGAFCRSRRLLWESARDKLLSCLTFRCASWRRSGLIYGRILLSGFRVKRLMEDFRKVIVIRLKWLTLCRQWRLLDYQKCFRWCVSQAPYFLAYSASEALSGGSGATGTSTAECFAPYRANTSHSMEVAVECASGLNTLRRVNGLNGIPVRIPGDLLRTSTIGCRGLIWLSFGRK